jgi:hypothetical protein
MNTIAYLRIARRAAYVAIAITAVVVLPLVNLNPHMDLRALMVLDAPMFLLMEPASSWLAWAFWVVGVFGEFIWVWVWTFVIWLIVLRSNRAHGI